MQFINQNTNFEQYKTKFIRIPLEILENGVLKPIDRLVYGCLRNRLAYSIERNSYDDKGYYLYYPQEKLANELGVSKRTVGTCFQRLKEALLIDYVEDSSANKIYLCEYEVDAKYLLPKKEKKAPAPSNPPQPEQPVEAPAPVVEPFFSESQLPLSWYAENYSAIFAPSEPVHSEIISCYGETFAPYSENFSCQDANFASNNILYKTYNKNYNNHSFYHSSNTNNKTLDQQMERVIEFYHERLDMDYLKETYPHEPLIDEVFNLVIDMHIDEVTEVNGQGKNRDVVRSVLGKLTHMHIEDVVDTYRSRTVKVNFPHAYLKTLIYNSALTLSAKTANQVMHDSYGKPKEENVQKPSHTNALLNELIESGIF